MPPQGIKIKAHSKNRPAQVWLELWEYRPLLGQLLVRSWKLRFAQTRLGGLWLLIQPLSNFLIFVLLFQVITQVDSRSLPYPLFVISGLISWQYFSRCISLSGNSLLELKPILQRVYFPKLLAPLAKSILALIDLAIQLLLFFVLAFFYEYHWPPTLLFLPAFLLFLLLFSLGLGIGLSVLLIKIRDLQAALGHLLTMGLYLSPIAYSADLLPTKYQGFYFLNPMAGIVEGIRWCISGKDFNNYMYISYITSLIICTISIWYFFKNEKDITDIL